MSGKFALIIANTEYTDPGLAKLAAPGKDAEEFARVLKSPDIAAFDDVNKLYNEDVFNVNLAIEDFFAHKKPDDLLVLYFSGHGVRDEYGSLHLAVKNTDRTRLRSTAIRSNFIREAMDYSRSNRQVLILDCCNSGAFAQGTKAEVGGSVGTASAFGGTGYGRVVLTASDSTQFAWEGDKVIGETVNSLFTHFLVKGLEGEADRNGDGTITVDELYDYAYEQIVSRTPKQTPGKWSYKQQGEIVLRQNIRIEDTRPVPLPDDLIGAINSSLPYIREGAVRQLEVMLGGRNLGLARSARLALEKIAAEDDSRRVSQIAADILERTQAKDALTAKKAEEEQMALERVKAAEDAAREKAEREAAEKAVREKAEREAAEKAARKRAEYEAAEKAAREKAQREAAEKAAREKAERQAARRAALVKKLYIVVSSLKNAVLKPPVPKIAGILGISTILFFVVLMAVGPGEIYFTSNRDGKAEIYKMSGSKVERVTHTPDKAESWSPALSPGRTLYFTSDRDGKAEIYKLSDDKTERVTHTPGNAESWSPVVSLGGTLYFTSGRDGKAEIYKLSDDKAERVTHTLGKAESWSPMMAPGGTLYFTSDRDGKAEIYKLINGETVRVTHTPDKAESWSSVISPGGTLYFTSDRDGKAEIYKMSDSSVVRVTHTAGIAECWSPKFLSGDALYLTSNRDGKVEVYKLNGSGVIQVTHTEDKFESWTGTQDQQSQGLIDIFLGLVYVKTDN